MALPRRPVSASVSSASFQAWRSSPTSTPLSVILSSCVPMIERAPDEPIGGRWYDSDRPIEVTDQSGIVRSAPSEMIADGRCP